MMPSTIDGLAPRAYLERLIADLFTRPRESPRKAVDSYLTLDAVHHADGKLVTREEFIAHLEFYQRSTKSLEFDIQQVVFDGEWLSARHLGRAVLHGGKTIDSEVVMFFHIIDGRVDRSFEVTRPVSGSEADRAIHTAR
jgi:hypothetical protein